MNLSADQWQYLILALIVLYALLTSERCRRMMKRLIRGVDRVAAANEDMAESLRDIKKSLVDQTPPPVRYGGVDEGN